MSFDDAAPEDRLSDLVASFERVVHQVQQSPDVKYWAEMVAYYSPSDSPRGFYVPANLIKSLASIGASLDIDVVPDLGAPGSR